MRATRREALQAAAGCVCGMSLAGGRSRAAENVGFAEREDAMETMRPLDYGLSFVCNTAAANAVRFWVESRTRIIDDAAGTWTDYYQCGSCKSEHTFAERDLFHKDNYDFLPILGEGYWLIFRRPVGLSARYRSVNRVEELWDRPVLKLKEASEVTVLDTWAAIRDATAAAIPLVTQTEIADTETGLRAVIECPTKTMNVSLDKQRYRWTPARWRSRTSPSGRIRRSAA